jgi:hypothetical protein
VPEMQRCHLAPVILQLKALGINNVLRFHYLARPPAYAMTQVRRALALRSRPSFRDWNCCSRWARSRGRDC